MQLRRKTRMHSEVSTHSMNDIMFFLMLFFLLVSTMVVTSGIKIALPKAAAGKNIGKQNIVLAVDSALNYYLNNKPVTREELEQRLTEVAKKDTSKEATIIFKADGRLTLQQVVDVMDMGQKLKLKMVMATDKKR
ncbi:MAG: biopolymer transporter ExbD [Chitinophagales bacterium]|nr:biopolymer transporter ExbD [Chitinophagales bacterium]MDW8418692.1 biopolymer transporter ExbD [Chitinophagales bacterium]